MTKTIIIIWVRKQIEGFKMDKVYITKASTRLIFKSLKEQDAKVTNVEIQKELEDDFANASIVPENAFNIFFNFKELKNIYKMKMIFKNLDTLLSSVADNKEIVTKYIEIENKRYVKDVKAPAYHTLTECKWLNSDFSNIQMPTEIKDAAMREKIKGFLNIHKDKKFDEINTLYKEEFGSLKDLVEVHLKNSGTENFDNNEMIASLIAKIKNEFSNMDSILHSGVNNAENKTIKNIKYADSWRIKSILKGNLSNEDAEKVKKFMETKKSLEETIFNFYREKYNKDLSFEGTVLDSIGFRICSGCASASSAVPSSAV